MNSRFDDVLMLGDDDLVKICKLAKIDIPDCDRDVFLAKLNSVFSWIDQLSKIDVSIVDGVDDKCGLEDKFSEQINGMFVMNSRESVMKNAKFQKFDMFCVPKVVE
jgi:aspartyl/glutamyl-tRNA(Asn/Gln) amidotransferase C subunit